jgi:iron complex transport system substrate-binding protein
VTAGKSVRRVGTSLLGAGWLFALTAAASPGPTPDRIVSLAPSVTETLFALGVGARVVGVTEQCDFPPEARTIEKVGSYLRPNVEVIVALRPERVIAVPSPGNREAVIALKHLGLSVLVVPEATRLAELYGGIRAIAEAVGRSREGEELVRQLEETVRGWRQRVAGFPRRRVLVVLERRPLVAVGRENLVDELIAAAGGENVAAGLGRWPRIGKETLVQMDPEVILESTMDGEDPADFEFYRDLGLRAARSRRIFRVNLDAVVRPGPRIGEGLAALARLLHPEIASEAEP